MAWHFKYFNFDSELAKLEIETGEKKNELRSQSEPISLWEWRKFK